MPAATTSWAGWFTDAQLAAEQAPRLAARLGSAVNTTLLAQQWLAAHPGHRPQHKPQRKRRRRHAQAVRPAPLYWPAPPPPPPAQQQKPVSPPPPRAFLNSMGVTAALTAALLAFLLALWALAWQLGQASAIAALLDTGLGETGQSPPPQDLDEQGRERLEMILATLLSRLERVLEEGLRDGASPEDLARRLAAVLGSLTSALLITQSEITWASGLGALALYRKAGIKYKRWQSRNDAKVCQRCMANQRAGAIPMDKPFPGGALAPLQHPRCRCSLLPATPPPAAVKGGKGEDPVAAGLAVRAADTGRILMLQRHLDPDDDDDPAGGMWEFPGGRLEDGENALEAARREWAEETGMAAPDGEPDGLWNSKDGRYRGFVVTVPAEEAVDILGGRDDVANPDDPDGDLVESLAWWDPGDLKDNPVVRPELAASAKRVQRALKSAETPELEATPHLLGTHGLWHTPDRHVGAAQKLPNYVEHIATALMRDQGLDESTAIAYSINAIKRWAKGNLGWGRRKITPEVVAASRRALAEWEALRASHH